MKDEDILALANGIAVTSVFSSTIIYRVHLAETDSQEKARAEADSVRSLLTEYLTLRSRTLDAEAKVADTADMLEHAKENIAGWRRAFGTTTPDEAVRRFRDAEAKVAELETARIPVTLSNMRLGHRAAVTEAKRRWGKRGDALLNATEDMGTLCIVGRNDPEGRLIAFGVARSWDAAFTQAAGLTKETR